MFGLDNLDTLFVVWAFLFQIFLIIHFSIRKWAFSIIPKFGWITYGLSIPAVMVSVLLLLGGKDWSFWLGGFIFFVFAVFGFTVEYIKGIQWRSPIRWPIFVPYVFFYLAAVMFYWWPLGLLNRNLWFVYAVLFLASTMLNITSHKVPQEGNQPA